MVTINRAVDHLIDVLAGEDVPVVGSKATRVDQLADMIEDGTIVIGGGGGAFIVHFGLDDHGNYTSDKTLAEILAAAEAGEAVFGTTANGNDIPLVGADAEHGAAFLAYMIDADSALQELMFTIAPDGSITDSVRSYDLSSLVVE